MVECTCKSISDNDKIICPICNTVLKKITRGEWAKELGVALVKRCNLSQFCLDGQRIKIECSTCGIFNYFTTEK